MSCHNDGSRIDAHFHVSLSNDPMLSLMDLMILQLGHRPQGAIVFILDLLN